MIDFVVQIFNKKTIYRILFNRKVNDHCCNLKGVGIDLAGGGDASYYGYLSRSNKIVRTNYIGGVNIDKIVDLEEKLDFPDKSFDYVLFFNALYIIKNRSGLLHEIRRVLKDDGTVYIASPFISNEMPEPHDYARLTHEGLESLFRETGFTSIKIERFGERFTVVAYITSVFYPFAIVRLVMYAAALLLDSLIPERLRKRHPTPLGYFCIIKK